ncbi:MAG: DNA polymerase I [Candidatus Berkelbacteria bacterium]|nr:DNA polymerase I [Candidatus Berkelbacteria bacterium]
MSKGLPKILLLDSNALIHRSFHALPPLTTPKGEQVNAVYGFANALLKAIKDEKPDYVVACFDAGRETFRNEIFDGYKAHRKETDTALIDQFPRVRQIVDVLNIPAFEQKGVEADDLIGSLAAIATKDGLQTVVVTGDNDSLQLVNDSVSIYSLRRGVTDTLVYHRDDVKGKMGVFPEQIVDYKALSGDSSDNIPGAPGIGPKTAVELLEKYHNLENIYEHLDELKDRPRQILADNKETVMMSRRLAAIRLDLDVELDLKVADVANFNFSKVVGLFQELGFKSLLAKMPQVAAAGQASLFETKKVETSRIESTLPFEVVKTLERWKELAKELQNKPILCIDTETVNLDGELIGIAFAWNKDKAAYLPLKPHTEGFELKEVKDTLSDLLCKTDIKKVGHNLKYDLHALSKAGIEVGNIWFDTMIASQLVNSTAYSHRLDDLAMTELNFKKIPTLQLLGGKKDGKMTEASVEDLAAYACEDVLVTWRLFEKMAPSLEEAHLKRVFYEIEMPLLPILVEMEATGIKIDRKYLKVLGEKLTLRLKEIEKEAAKQLGEGVNIASPSQLQDVLFNKLKLPVIGIKKIKSGYSTDADSLMKLRDKHPAIKLILEYRELAKLLNTYIETLPDQIDKVGRVHTSFGQIGAATGRMSSNNPNLQNIPIRTDLGNEVRRAFVADTGKVFLGADYSQAELRVLAHLCGDSGLIEAFRSGQDFHTQVGEKLMVDRRSAKAINFGIIYGLGSNALANDLGIPVTAAKDFIDKYFATFPGVRDFIESCKRQARETGYAETMFGRRRYLPDIHSPNMMLRSAAERIAVNMPNQGSVADLMKYSMVQVAPKLPEGAKMLLQIHDELLFEVGKGLEEKVAKIVKEVMGSVADLKVPMVVDVKVGPNWADLQHYLAFA